MIIYNSPPDIMSWPIVADITKITMTGGVGIKIESPALSKWPDYRPFGWDGDLQYTVWLVVNGQLYASGIIQMWRTRQADDPTAIPPILTNYNKNYCYDARWGEMTNYIPKVGDEMSFMLSAGDARGQGTVTSVRERTSIFSLKLPVNDDGVFTNGDIPVPPTPSPNPNNPGYDDSQMVKWAKACLEFTQDTGMICVHSGRFMYDATVGPDNIHPMGYDASFEKHILELKHDAGAVKT